MGRLASESSEFQFFWSFHKKTTIFVRRINSLLVVSENSAKWLLLEDCPVDLRFGIKDKGKPAAIKLTDPPSSFPRNERGSLVWRVFLAGFDFLLHRSSSRRSCLPSPSLRSPWCLLGCFASSKAHWIRFFESTAVGWLCHSLGQSGIIERQGGTLLFLLRQQCDCNHIFKCRFCCNCCC